MIEIWEEEAINCFRVFIRNDKLGFNDRDEIIEQLYAQMMGWA